MIHMMDTKTLPIQDVTKRIISRAVELTRELNALKTGLNAVFSFWHCEINYKTATNA